MALDSDSFLPDAEDCAEAWRRNRWDEGLYFPECGSEQVQTRQQNYRDHLHRYYCEACGKWFPAASGLSTRRARFWKPPT
jgi:transposase-like protein